MSTVPEVSDLWVAVLAAGLIPSWVAVPEPVDSLGALGSIARMFAFASSLFSGTFHSGC